MSSQQHRKQNECVQMKAALTPEVGDIGPAAPWGIAASSAQGAMCCASASSLGCRGCHSRSGSSLQHSSSSGAT